MKMRNFFKSLFNVEHLFVVVITGILSFIAYGILLLSVGFINPVKRAVENFSLSDLYYGVDWDTEEQPDNKELITLIDATPLYERAGIANLLEEVDSCSPKVVGVDLIFERKMCDTIADAYLQEVAMNMKNAVFACKLLPYEKSDTLKQGNEEGNEVKDGSFCDAVHSYFSEAFTPNEGYANTVGGAYATVLRDLSIERKLNGKPIKSFAAAVAEAALPGSLPKIAEEKYPIRYSHVDFPVVSCDSVLAHRELIEGRIALIGTLNIGEDMHFTPIGGMPGLKVQAYSIQTLLDGHGINDIPTVWCLIAIFVFTYITAFWQLCWLRFCRKGNKPWLFFLGESKLVLRVLTLLWLAVIAWIGYFLYDHFALYANSVWLMVCVVLVGEGRGIYTALLKTIRKYKRFASSIVERSIYLENHK